jgi:hypothetical protein
LKNEIFLNLELKNKYIMKRNLFTIALIFIFATSLNAQEFEEGDKVLNLGIGFGSATFTGSFYNPVIPPLSASFEVGIKDGLLDFDDASLGVGGFVGFSRYKWEWNSFGLAYGYNYTNFVIGARGVIHYPFIEKLDTYGGILVGYRIVSSSDFGDPVTGTNYSTVSNNLVGSFFIGGRYYFTDNLAAMLELGYGVSTLNFGIALKL